MDIEALMEKASVAEPESSARPRRWAALWPVYAKLRSRGYSCVRAVDWLKREGEVPEGYERRALNAFHILATRKNAKARTAQHS